MLQELIKMETKLQKNISYILKFIIYLEIFIELNVNWGTIIKNVKHMELYCNCFLEYTNFRDNLIECKCLRCNKNYQHKFDEKLRTTF